MGWNVKVWFNFMCCGSVQHIPVYSSCREMGEFIGDIDTAMF